MLWQRAKGLAYSFLIAFPPLLIFFVSLIAYFPVQGLQDELLFQLHGVLPASIYDYISDTVNDIMNHRHSNLLSIGFISAIVLATFGMNGLLMSFNFANKSVENRPLLQRLGICLLLVVTLFVLLAFALALFLGYKLLIKYLVENHILVHNNFSFLLINIGRWLLMILSILVLVSFIYYLAPAKRHQLGFFSIGSTVATAMFFLFSWGFQVYINNFNNFNIIYGSIGSVLVLMLWIFFNCLVLLIGYELNLAVYTGREHQEQRRLFKMDFLREQDRPLTTNGKRRSINNKKEK